jgi:hypothetical protein
MYLARCLPFIALLNPGKEDCERHPSLRLTLDFYLPTALLDDPIDGGETQPDALRVILRCRSRWLLTP